MTIEMPDNPTNGDVISVLFANCRIDKFIHDVNIRKNLNVVAHFNKEWWNEPWVIDDAVGMTRREAAGVIKIEKACVLRQDTPQCHRNCKKCDLLLPTEDVLTAYDIAIKALEQEPCDSCETGNPCLYCKYEFESNESEE